MGKAKSGKVDSESLDQWGGLSIDPGFMRQALPTELGRFGRFPASAGVSCFLGRVDPRFSQLLADRLGAQIYGSRVKRPSVFGK